MPRSRSSSSASKKRQEEELAKNTAANTSREAHPRVENALSIDTSVHQSPPPVKDGGMPVGAVVSPPDSGHNSSDEEGGLQGRREDTEDMEELEKAVRGIEVVRGGSPDMDREFQFPPRSDGQEASTPPPELSKSARKISHSRSSTDSAIVLSPQPEPFDSPANTSISDGSDDEGEKPPLIRKKSGELVKPAIRPKSRRTASSMPGTPTYGKKGVHFNDDIQQVKHFLQVDRPIAVSAGGSPVEAFDEEGGFPFGKQPPSPTSSVFGIRLGNFPRETFERLSQPVRLDRITLSADQKSLVGHVVVVNLAFHKHVVARFTFDSWRTTSEVVGEYNADPSKRQRNGFDLFTFTIKLSDQTHIERKTMFICIRYSVNGRDYWDNNSDHNYHVDFVRGPSQPSAAPGLGSRPIPRSRRNSLAPRPRSTPSFDDDFSRNFEVGPDLKLKQPSKVDGPPVRRQNPASQQFGTRYDFGASLTAALNQAQNNLGDRSTSRNKEGASIVANDSSQDPPKSSISRLQRHTPAQPGSNETPRPDTLHANRTSLDSRAYQDFVAKFCFFGSGKSQSNIGTPESSGTPTRDDHSSGGHDGTSDEPRPVSVQATGQSLTPKEASSQRSQEQQNGTLLSPQLLARTGGSHSPSPDFDSPQGYDSRSSSPASLGYPFGQNAGLLSSGATTPATAIQG